jgi:hypothetical protein
MPLLPNVLEAQLKQLDTKKLDTVEKTAQAWFDAWWAYAQNMTYLVPGGGGRVLVEQSFKGILMGGLQPIPVPITFFTMLGNAMLASWASLGTPATLIPPILSLIPQPAPFGPMGVGVVPVGLATKEQGPPKQMLATLIHTWTITAQAVGPTGPVGPIS